MIMCCEKKEKKNHWKRNMMTKVTLEGVMMKKNDQFNFFFAKIFYFSLEKRISTLT